MLTYKTHADAGSLYNTPNCYGIYICGKVFKWLKKNGGLGALIAGGNPLTILVSFVGAPVTSLCPFIGVGIVAGIVQAAICKPQVKDLETLSDDAGSKMLRRICLNSLRIKYSILMKDAF